MKPEHNIQTSKRHQELAKILLMTIYRHIYNANESNTITYGNIYSEVGINGNDPKYRDIVTGRLGDLSTLAYQNDLPLISAIVVSSKDPFLPGKGFFRLYSDLTESTNREDKVVFEDVISQIYNSNEWLRFAEILEVDLPDAVAQTLKNNPLSVHRHTPIKFPSHSTINRKSLYLNRPNKPNSIEENQRITVLEGKVLENHKVKERNQTIVQKVKSDHKLKYPTMPCEVCSFSFRDTYGDIGADFIEAHHNKRPLSEYTTEEKTCIDDFKLVCSNCHQMLHIKRFKTVEQLKEVLRIK